jgi:hypothetical protein
MSSRRTTEKAQFSVASMESANRDWFSCQFRVRRVSVSERSNAEAVTKSVTILRLRKANAAPVNRRTPRRR